jgi:hypothetical protein
MSIKRHLMLYIDLEYECNFLPSNPHSLIHIILVDQLSSTVILTRNGAQPAYLVCWLASHSLSLAKLNNNVIFVVSAGMLQKSAPLEIIQFLVPSSHIYFQFSITLSVSLEVIGHQLILCEIWILEWLAVSFHCF